MKEETAYHTISEVSKKLNLPTHVLRFWEKKFNNLNPKKGIGGRRYYSLNDMEKLKLIKKLLHQQGFTIPGAIKYLKEENQKKPNLEENQKVLQLLGFAISSLDKAKNIIKSY